MTPTRTLPAQGDLFAVRRSVQTGRTDYAMPHFQAHSETSRQGAIAAYPRVNGPDGLRAKIRARFRGIAEFGFTDAELLASMRAEFPNIKEGTVRARRCDERDDGYIVDSGVRRAGMTVWRART